MTETIGHNQGPLIDQIELAFSVQQLGEDHADLAAGVTELCVRAAELTAVSDKAGVEAASALVIELRDKAKEVDDAHDTVKKPVWDAGKNVTFFFGGINNSDTKRPGPVTSHKLRLERLIRDHGFKVAEEERQRAAAAAAAERERAARAAKAAEEAEAANRQNVAEVILESAVKSEAIADSLDARAQGPVQDLARVRTAVATSGLRAVPGFEIVDRDALRGSLGVLGHSFTADAVMAAIRKFRADAEAFEKWGFASEDQDQPKRYVKASPELPGVAFYIEYAGSVRA